MKIGIIGSGEMGLSLASILVKLGHTVAVANSRGPACVRQLTKGLGVEAVTVEGATVDMNLIIVSIHQKNVEDLPKNLFKAIPEGVFVIDTGNYYPNLRGGPIQALDEKGIDSLWVQEQLGVPVIKVFNSILASSLKVMGRPSEVRDRIALPVSGDNGRAKAAIATLLDDMGFDCHDMGPIAHSWRQQPGSPIYCRNINLEELRRRVSVIGSSPEMLQAIIARRKADEFLMRDDYPKYLQSLID